MTARDYIEQYRQAQRKADSLRTKYNDLIEAYGDVGGTDYMNVRPTGISKPTERKAEKAADALERWRAAQLDALEIRQNVFALLTALPCNEGDILIERYINLRTWEQIEAATGYSHCAVHKIHRQALQLLQDLIDSGALDLLQTDTDAYFSKYINTWT